MLAIARSLVSWRTAVGNQRDARFEAVASRLRDDGRLHAYEDGVLVVDGLHLTFIPSAIRGQDPRLVQQSVCARLAEHSASHNRRVDSLTVDLRDLTVSMARDMVADAHTGIDVWAYAPLSIARVHVLPPRNFRGWRVLAPLALACVSKKMRERVRIEC